MGAMQSGDRPSPSFIDHMHMDMKLMLLLDSLTQGCMLGPTLGMFRRPFIPRFRPPSSVFHPSLFSLFASQALEEFKEPDHGNRSPV